ncbi:CBS domain-containing protein [Globicatella sanguinis]|uniref:CBS domain-containing protein n=1 Tax=Globicatella sanguinis TaxID=13076 RepID=UPI000825546D|nr:CBS domain-containing protein [Globicatella sanguinis]
MSKNEFLALFNELEITLQKVLDSKETMFILLEQAKAQSRINPVSVHWDLLYAARQLRNLLTHQTTTDIPEIAEPSTYLIETLKRIVTQYKSPVSIMEYLKAQKDETIITFKVGESLQRVFTVIKEKHYSQFPVFDDHEYIGLISENGITNWLAEKVSDESMMSEDLVAVKIDEVLKLEEKNHRVTKIYKENNLFQLIELFEKSQSTVILVCEKQNLEMDTPDDIVGILTNSDISLIYQLFDNDIHLLDEE